MGQIPVTGVRLLVSVLFAIGFMGPQIAVPSSPAIGEDKITIRFRGLLVFSEVKNGEEVVRLFSHAMKHRLQIQLKGPNYDDFEDWADSYPDDSELTLHVTNSKIPTWDSPLPFNIAELHKDGKFEIVESVFKPTLTINSGTFKLHHSVKKKDIKFENGEYKPHYPVNDVPRDVVAKIKINHSQEATLKGKGLPTINLKGGDWEIVVRNNPSHEHICEDHFLYYYKTDKLVGFLLDGAEVPKPKRYKPKVKGQEECMTQLEEKRMLPTRPCIPISY